MSVKSTILAEMEKVAKEQDQTLAPLTDDLVLIEFGPRLSRLRRAGRPP